MGDVVVTLDGDLQNDPDDIPRLVEHLLYGGDIGAELADGRGRGSGTVRDDGGYDMVCGWRRNRRDDVIRRVPSQIANWLIGRVTGVRLTGPKSSVCVSLNRSTKTKMLKRYSQRRRARMKFQPCGACKTLRPTRCGRDSQEVKLRKHTCLKRLDSPSLSLPAGPSLKAWDVLLKRTKPKSASMAWPQ